MRIIFATPLKAALVFACLMFSSLNVGAQTAAVRPSRITQAVNENNLVVLRGNTHPLAQAKNDQGPAPDSLPMNRMLMVLQRSPDQEMALKTFIEGQQSKSSPNFGQWLTPEQFGQQYGVSDEDIQTVTGWLQTHGFQINRVATGKMLIEFSGTAGQIKEAFHTQIHNYMVNGEAHVANASDPQIPAALAPVVKGVNTMHNFRKKSMIHNLGLLTRTASNGGATPQDTSSCPQGTASGLTPMVCNGVGPADFAKIYNVPATVGGVTGGTGQTIAIVGDSEINLTDVRNFRTLFSLPTGGATNTPQIILDGPDPTFNGDEIEGDLDVEYSAAVAPNAQILFVIAEDTESSQGIDLAAEHIIDYNLAPVLSESFGECEAELGSGGNAFYSTLWEQAAAQGITVILASGDQGAATCDRGNEFAQFGLAVSGFASTPFNVAAGGTDFDFTATGYPANFWSTSTGAGGLTAKGYIAETSWNDTCAQSAAGQNTGCSSFVLSSSSPLLQVDGGGGGQSNCAEQDEFGDCIASYSKPSWQTGSSVPNDLVRDVPDISLFSASGQRSGSFYMLCESDLGATCASGGSSFSFIAVGGTSAAAPAFAGIMALVNQNMVTSGKPGRQGNANFVLYPMSAAQTESSCNSSTGPTTSCVFNDVTKGNNSVPCIADTPNCSITTANSQQVGVLETVNTTGVPTGTLGFASGTGYDLATGLGSINVTNLVNGWPAASGVFTPTATSLTLGPLTTCPAGTPAGITSCLSIVHGATVSISVTVTGGSNIVGDATLVGTCQSTSPNCFPTGANTAAVDRFDAFSGNVDFGTLTNGTVSGTTKELVGGKYNATAHYAGDGVHGASDSTPPIQVTVSPEGSKTTDSIYLINPFTGNATAVTTAQYGSFLDVRTDIVGASSGFETATGQVTLTDSFAGSSPVVLNLNADGHVDLETPTISFPGNNPQITTIPALALGTHNFTSAYAGDSSYSASNSTSVPLTVTQAATATTIITAPTSVTANTNFPLVAFVDTESVGVAPTGTVTFFVGSTSLGSASVVASQDSSGFIAGQATLTTAKISATSSITAQYVGDTNYLTSTSAAVSVTVIGSAFTLTPATNPVSVVAGSSGTSVITVAPSNGFTGSVGLSCGVVPTNLTSTPTCTFSATPIVLGASQTSTLMVATTATTTAGAYTVTVTGTSGSTVVTTTVTVNVSVPVVPSFTLTPSSNPTIAAGSSGTSVITVSPVNGFTGTVGLSCGVTPSTTSTPTCSFNPTSVVLGAGGTSTMTVTTTATTPAGAFTVTVTGTSGATVKTATVSVSVTGVFTISPASSSFTATAPGQSGVVTINAAATAGFPYTIALSATVASATQSFPPSCSFPSPGTIALTQAAPSGSATLTCTTTAADVFIRPTTRPEGPRWLVPSVTTAAALAFAFFLLWIPSLRKRRGLVFAGFAIFVAGIVCAGCGSTGGGSGGTTTPVGTNAGSYTVTVTATGGGTSQTTTATFVLQ